MKTKLIVLEKEAIEVPVGISLSRNGVVYKELSIEGLDKMEIDKIKKNPKDKTILAKIDRIKRGEK